MSNETEQRYTVMWKLMPTKRGGVTINEVPKDMGAAQGVMLTNIMATPDGDISCAFHGYSGGNGGSLVAMPAIELFRVWVHMAGMLAERKDLADGNRAICGQLFDKIAEAVAENAKKLEEAEVKH